MAITFDQVIALLDAAGLWEEMLPFVEMERLPAGGRLFRNVTISDPAPEHLGGDSSGGAYVRLSGGAVLLLSSEGEVGVVGADLQAVLGHGLGTGGLYHALRFMGRRDMETARADWLADRVRWYGGADPLDDPAAREIAEVLDLDLPADPFASLHRAIWSTPVGLVRMGDEPFERFGAAQVP